MKPDDKTTEKAIVTKAKELGASLAGIARIEDLKASPSYEAYSNPEIIQTAPHNSTVHQTIHDSLDDPDQWAVTWRAYLRKTGQGQD